MGGLINFLFQVTIVKGGIRDEAALEELISGVPFHSWSDTTELCRVLLEIYDCN